MTSIYLRKMFYNIKSAMQLMHYRTLKKIEKRCYVNSDKNSCLVIYDW